MKFSRETVVLALGLAIGSGVGMALRPPIALAEQASGMQQMSGMRASGATASAGDREMNAAMERMMQAAAKSKLTKVQDEDFMTMMIPHHQAAVDMAQIELARGSHPALKALARNIVAGQSREIAQMHAWLKAWYPAR